MFKFKNIIVTFAAVVLFTAADGLPTYITKCSKTSPHLNKCIVENAKLAIPEISKGDALLLIPNLNTLNPEDQVINIDNLRFHLKNIQAKSAELVPTDAKMNFETLAIEIGLFMKYLNWHAEFEATGNIHDKPIDQTGHVNITFDDLQIKYVKHFEEKQIDGKTYLQIKSGEVNETIQHIDVKLQFSGDKPNDIQRKALKKMVPKLEVAIKERLTAICAQLVSYIMNTILRTVPKDEVFLP